MKFNGQSMKTGGGSINPIDKILYEKFFPGKTDGFYIEAGANDGLFLSTCKVFEDLGWGGINIEPNKRLFAELCKNRPTAINLNIALSNVEGEVEFEEIDFDNYGFSRIKDLYRHETIDKTFNLKSLETYSMIAKPYSQVITEFSIPKVDLFVLDVEGFEPEVIQGMEGCTVLPDVFCVEWTHCGLDILCNLLKGKYKLDFSDSLNAIFIK
jgi:FkbM family methyltransferase